MGHGGYTLELSLRDSVSAGLDMGRPLSECAGTGGLAPG